MTIPPTALMITVMGMIMATVTGTGMITVTGTGMGTNIPRPHPSVRASCLRRRLMLSSLLLR